MIKILHGTGCYQFLGNVGTALGVGAEPAFVLGSDLDIDGYSLFHGLGFQQSVVVRERDGNADRKRV